MARSAVSSRTQSTSARKRSEPGAAALAQAGRGAALTIARSRMISDDHRSCDPAVCRSGSLPRTHDASGRPVTPSGSGPGSLADLGDLFGLCAGPPAAPARADLEPLEPQRSEAVRGSSSAAAECRQTGFREAERTPSLRVEITVPKG